VIRLVFENQERKNEEFCDAVENGARLAKGAAKGTGYVRATVFPTCAASPKNVSPLVTVRSLGPFFTIVEGRISLEATTVVKQLSDRQRADVQRLPTCGTRQHPG